MNAPTRWITAAAGLFGLTGVALGAFGAHALKDSLTARGTLPIWQTAVLYQDGQRIGETPFTKDAALDELLTAYVSFEHPEVREFKEAVDRFKGDIPSIVTTLRGMIVGEGKTNAAFRTRPSGKLDNRINFFRTPLS